MNESVTHRVELSHQRLRAQAKRVAGTLLQFSAGHTTDCGRLQDQASMLLDEYRESHEPLIKQLVGQLTRAVGPAQELLQTTVGAHGSDFYESLRKLMLGLDGLSFGHMVARDDILAEGIRSLHHLEAQLKFERQVFLSDREEQEPVALDALVAQRALSPSSHASGVAA